MACCLAIPAGMDGQGTRLVHYGHLMAALAIWFTLVPPHYTLHGEEPSEFSDGSVVQNAPVWAESMPISQNMAWPGEAPGRPTEEYPAEVKVCGPSAT